MKLASTVLTVLLVASGASCTTTKKDRGSDAARDAIAKLRKIQAATQVGVNKLNYSPLLIEAKAAVNEANPKLEGNLKKEINAAMDAYTDASAIWEAGQFLYTDLEPGATWKTRYELTNQSTIAGRPYADRDAAVRSAWAAADRHIAAVNKIINPPDINSPL